MKNLWVPISGALARQKQVETIANNVANANTPGFKKDRLTFKEYLTVLEKGYDDIDLPDKEWSPEDFYRSYGAENSQVKVDANFTDFEQGQLVPTGNPLDIALKGKGFFEVLTPNGIRYTRRGTFTLNPDGFIVNNQGHFLLSKASDGAESGYDSRKVQITTPGNISVNLKGDLFVNNEEVSKLSVVEFNDIHSLRKEGNSYFINKDLKNILTSDNATNVHQGFVEQSNVNAISEMSELIKANRQFESIQRVIKAYDSIAGKAANDIANF